MGQDFRHIQTDINWKMREILIDWLVHVHLEFKQTEPTLWLTVNIVDRVLLKVELKRTDLQLVGVAAWSLASKQEEYYSLSRKTVLFCTDDAYNRQQLHDMELSILKTINYELIVPTAYHFLVRYCELIHASDVTRMLALYYEERFVQCSEGALCKPSLLAAVALCAALAQRQAQDRPTCTNISHELLQSCVDNGRHFCSALKDMADGDNPADEGQSRAVPCVFESMLNYLTKLEEFMAPTHMKDDVPRAVPTSISLWGVPLTLSVSLPPLPPSMILQLEGLRDADTTPRATKAEVKKHLTDLLALDEVQKEATPASVESGVQALLREIPAMDTAEVRALAIKMIAVVRIEKRVTASGRNLQATRKKYARQVPFLDVATLPLPDLERGGFLAAEAEAEASPMTLAISVPTATEEPV